MSPWWILLSTYVWITIFGVLSIVHNNFWCVVPSSYWQQRGDFNYTAKLLRIVPDNGGYSPYNTFPNMTQMGQCLDMHLGYRKHILNVTITCRNTYVPSVDVAIGPSELGRVSRLDFRIDQKGYITLVSCFKMSEQLVQYGELVATKGTDDIARYQSELYGINAGSIFPMVQYISYQRPCQCVFRNEFLFHVKPATDRAAMGSEMDENVSLRQGRFIVLGAVLLLIVLCAIVKIMKS